MNTMHYLIMPALTSTMTEGKLARWFKSAGDRIKKGEVVAEIETDKAVMELEAEEDGAITSILVTEGTEAVPINQPLATIVPDVPVADSFTSFESGHHDSTKQSAKSASTPASTLPSRGVRVHASPSARRLAAQAGLDLSLVVGSGPNGRIIEADIVGTADRHLSPEPIQPPAPDTTAKCATVATAPRVESSASYTSVAHSPMRKSIARRLTESMTTIPQFNLTVDCHVDRLMVLRERLNQSAAAGRKYSVNDFIILAAAGALKAVPRINAQWLESEVRWYENIDIAVAVDTNEGLIAPVVRNADRKQLPDISQEMADLAQRARFRTLKPAEFAGGTFSISNLGMHGIASFVAIINPPQAAILAVGAAQPRAIVQNGQLAVATVMRCTLSCDHRLIDGALGAAFLQKFRESVEDPGSMPIGAET